MSDSVDRERETIHRYLQDTVKRQREVIEDVRRAVHEADSNRLTPQDALRRIKDAVEAGR